jgi:formate hydrogenlyase subunit 3/multisubunit Na+/H+ antiporter MnhD subunit
MVGTLWLLNNIYSIGYLKIKRIHFSNFMSLIFASICCVVLIGSSGNLITLFIFYEALTLITYFLVSFDKCYESQIAGGIYIKTLLVSSSSLFLIGIVAIYSFTGSFRFMDNGILNIFPDMQINWQITLTLLFLFLYGCAKAATIPLHFWLPKAMIAHTPVSALLHAVAVVKSGIIALLYIIIYIFGIKFLEDLSKSHEIAFSIPKYIAGFSAIYASIMALKKVEVKKVLAYSTIGQLGYMVMIIFSFHDGMPKVLILQLIAHAVTKINMFFIAGFLYLKYKIKRIDEINGIGKTEPIIGACFFISMLSIIGIPPTVGMIGKYNIILYCIHNKEYFMLGVIASGTIMSCYYLLPIITDMFFDKQIIEINIIEKEKQNHFKKYYLFLYISIVITSALVILLFFAPYSLINI